jgi:hypothetical protein
VKHLSKISFAAFLLASLLSSCMKTASLTVLQPAQMSLPEHITTVAVVDRSKPSKGWLNVLEGFVTGEAIGQDRQSREEAVRGLTDALTRTPRFAVKNTGIEMEGSKAGNNLPAPLAWSEVERICSQYGAHAVVTIESFDSDNSSSARRVENKRKDKNGKQYIDVSYQSRQRTDVRIGWRLYDPRTKIIIDEYTTDDYLEKTGSGTTERAALNNLPSQVSVTRSVAFNVGREYGARIAPIYVQVSRQYYGKAKGYKSDFQQAARFLKSREYDRAATILKKIEATATDNKKAAGRAAYNMAVVSELNGNLDLALDWSHKAWNDYGNKKARNYISVIEMRQNDVRKVESQMPKKKV